MLAATLSSITAWQGLPGCCGRVGGEVHRVFSQVFGATEELLNFILRLNGFAEITLAVVTSDAILLKIFDAYHFLVLLVTAVTMIAFPYHSIAHFWLRWLLRDVRFENLLHFCGFFWLSLFKV